MELGPVWNWPQGLWSYHLDSGWGRGRLVFQAGAGPFKLSPSCVWDCTVICRTCFSDMFFFSVSFSGDRQVRLRRACLTRLLSISCWVNQYTLIVWCRPVLVGIICSSTLLRWSPVLVRALHLESQCPYALQAAQHIDRALYDRFRMTLFPYHHLLSWLL